MRECCENPIPICLVHTNKRCYKVQYQAVYTDLLEPLLKQNQVSWYASQLTCASWQVRRQHTCVHLIRSYYRFRATSIFPTSLHPSWVYQYHTIVNWQCGGQWRRLPVTNFSSEKKKLHWYFNECSNHHWDESEEVWTNTTINSHALSMGINSNVCSHFFTFVTMMIGAFSRNVCKVFFLN